MFFSFSSGSKGRYNLVLRTKNTWSTEFALYSLAYAGQKNGVWCPVDLVDYLITLRNIFFAKSRI